MTFVDSVAELAHTTARLLIAGPSAAAGAVNDPVVVLAARDAVVGQIRALYGAVIGAGPEHTAQLAAGDPVAALYTALNELPRTAGDSAPPPTAIATVASTDGSIAGLWRAAAGAAITLERHVDTVRQLPGPAAWSVVRDLAELAAAIPTLDVDLARALPANHPAAAAAIPLLAGTDAHRVVRHAASDLQWRTSGHTSPTPQLASKAARPAPVRSIADLPSGTATLAELVRRRGRDIAMADVHAAARAALDGMSHAEHVLRNAAGAPHLRAADALAHAQPALRRVLASRVATLTAPSATIADLAGSVRHRLNTLSTLSDRLAGDANRRDQKTRLAAPALAWAREVPAVIAALHDALRIAAAADTLYAPIDRGEDVNPAFGGAAGRYLWRPLTVDSDDARLLGDVAAAAAAAAAADPAVRAAQPADRAPSFADAAAESIAALRTALAERSEPPTPPPLPDHPDPNRRTRSHNKPAVGQPPATLQRAEEPVAQTGVRWQHLVAEIDPRVLDDPHWAALSAALDRAARAGVDVPVALRALAERDRLPDQHPARDLHYRLVGICAASAVAPVGTAEPPAGSVAAAAATRPRLPMPAPGPRP
jgi:hypothetical protein